MANLNNPAGRLMAIIAKGKKIPRATTSKLAWGTLLEVSSSDLALLLRQIGLVLDLPRQIRSGIGRIGEIDPTVYLRWIPKLEDALANIQFDTAWSDFMDGFDETITDGLAVCDDVLSRCNPAELEQAAGDHDHGKRICVVHEEIKPAGFWCFI